MSFSYFSSLSCKIRTSRPHYVIWYSASTSSSTQQHTAINGSRKSHKRYLQHIAAGAGACNALYVQACTLIQLSISAGNEKLLLRPTTQLHCFASLQISSHTAAALGTPHAAVTGAPTSLSRRLQISGGSPGISTFQLLLATTQPEDSSSSNHGHRCQTV